MNIQFRCKNRICPEFEVPKVESDYLHYMRNDKFEQGKCLQCESMLTPDALPPKKFANREDKDSYV